MRTLKNNHWKIRLQLVFPVCNAKSLSYCKKLHSNIKQILDTFWQLLSLTNSLKVYLREKINQKKIRLVCLNIKKFDVKTTNYGRVGFNLGSTCFRLGWTGFTLVSWLVGLG